MGRRGERKGRTTHPMTNIDSDANMNERVQRAGAGANGAAEFFQTHLLELAEPLHPGRCLSRSGPGGHAISALRRREGELEGAQSGPRGVVSFQCA